jgi:hypothetical protein
MQGARKALFRHDSIKPGRACWDIALRVIVPVGIGRKAIVLKDTLTDAASLAGCLDDRLRICILTGKIGC